MQAGKMNPTVFLLALALGCYSTWVFLAFSGQGPVGIRNHLSLELALAASTIAFFAFACAPKRLLGCIRRSSVLPVVSAAGMAACMALSLFLGPDDQAQKDIACFLANVLSSMYAVCQFHVFSRLDQRLALAPSAAGYITAACCAPLLQIAGETVALLLGVLLPFASATALLLARKTLLNAKALRDPRRDREGCGLHAFLKANRALLQLAGALCAALFLTGIAHDNARTGYVHVLQALDTAGTPVMLAESACLYPVFVVIGVSIQAAVLRSAESDAAYATCYRIVLVALVAAQLLPLVPSDSIAHGTVFLPLHMGAFRCLLFLVWMLTLKISRDNPDLRLRIFCAASGSQNLGSWIGSALWASTFTDLPEFFYPLMFASVVMTLVAALLLFTESRLRALVRLTSDGSGGRFVQRCRAIADHYGLSNREREIMTMLAKGRNLDYIHKELYISKSTVSMHRQHIYQKLDIHSQQELISLIDNKRG